jgi:hypothetical protein
MPLPARGSRLDYLGVDPPDFRGAAFRTPTFFAATFFAGTFLAAAFLAGAFFAAALPAAAFFVVARFAAALLTTGDFDADLRTTDFSGAAFFATAFFAATFFTAFFAAFLAARVRLIASASARAFALVDARDCFAPATRCTTAFLAEPAVFATAFFALPAVPVTAPPALAAAVFAFATVVDVRLDTALPTAFAFSVTTSAAVPRVAATPLPLLIVVSSSSWRARPAGGL